MHPGVQMPLVTSLYFFPKAPIQAVLSYSSSDVVESWIELSEL